MTRLRWRLHGATMWPVFVLATVIEGIALDELPISGTTGPDGFIPSLLLATGLNLIVVAILAPLAGTLLRRRRRRDLPRAIATDYCATVLLIALLGSLLAAGLVNHSAVRQDFRNRAATFAATSNYVHSQAREYLDSLDATSTLRVEDSMYRACVPGEDPDKPLCLFVNTDQRPAGVSRDRDRTPNALWRR